MESEAKTFYRIWCQPLALFLVASLFTLTNGCAGHAPSPPGNSQNDTVVSNNLYQIGVILFEQVEDSDHYAPNFSELHLSSTEAKLFVLPGRLTGNLDTVQRWTDYIYVGNTPVEMVPHAALVVSPPENHGGEYGYVLFANQKVTRLPAQSVRALIQKPWLLATNSSPDILDYYKKQIKIMVPDRFASIYDSLQ